MAARILRPAPARAESHRPTARSAPLPEAAPRFQFWRGASGRPYVHTVYSLIECPMLPEANYVLVRRQEDSRRTVLHIGRANSSAPSLNLARVRQLGATLGANEVHVHLLTENEAQRRLVECDLRAGLFGTLDAEPSRSVLN